MPRKEYNLFSSASANWDAVVNDNTRILKTAITVPSYTDLTEINSLAPASEWKDSVALVGNVLYVSTGVIWVPLNVNGSIDPNTYGADPTGVTDSSAAILSASVAAISSSSKTIRFTPGSYRITSSVIIDFNIKVIFEPGAIIQRDSGSEIVFQDHVSALRTTIFTGVGTTHFGYEGVDPTTTENSNYRHMNLSVPIEWWGARGTADPNDAANNKTAIESCFSDLNRVRSPAIEFTGNYFTAGISASLDHVQHLKGRSHYASTITHYLAAVTDENLLTLSGTGQNGWIIEDLALKGSENGRNCLHVDDAKFFLMKQCYLEGAGTPIWTNTVSFTTSGTEVTVTSVAHGLSTGDFITVRNASTHYDLNLTFEITYLTDDTFKFETQEIWANGVTPPASGTLDWCEPTAVAFLKELIKYSIRDTRFRGTHGCNHGLWLRSGNADGFPDHTNGTLENVISYGESVGEGYEYGHGYYYDNVGGIREIDCKAEKIESIHSARRYRRCYNMLLDKSSLESGSASAMWDYCIHGNDADTREHSRTFVIKNAGFGDSTSGRGCAQIRGAVDIVLENCLLSNGYLNADSNSEIELLRCKMVTNGTEPFAYAVDGNGVSDPDPFLDTLYKNEGGTPESCREINCSNYNTSTLKTSDRNTVVIGETITSGSTTKVVNHTSYRAPDKKHVKIHFSGGSTNNIGHYWITGITATQLTVNVNSDPGSTLTFDVEIDYSQRW